MSNSQFVKTKDGWAQRVKGDVTVAESTILQPVDIQARYSQTIQTHNAVSVGANGWGASSWIDCNGFDKLALTLLNDASTASKAVIHWSHDGITHHGETSILSSEATAKRTSITDVQARYARININNADTVSHIMSAWVYLKA
jgi:hypothetical protein